MMILSTFTCHIIIVQLQETHHYSSRNMSIQVFVKTLNGKSLVVNVDPTRTVDDIKQYIYMREGKSVMD
jgi:hypothetical protein